VAGGQRLLYVRRMAMGARLKEVLEQPGRPSQAELARLTGVDEATISAIIQRDSERSKYATAIAAALHIRSHWLVTGEGPRDAENVEEHPSARARLPLISWVSAGLREEANDPYAPGNAEAWVDFDSPASSSAFCLRVRGDSMRNPTGEEPNFPDGCIIAIEPKRKPKSREFAVFRFSDTDEATFKQYIVDGPLKFLKPLNPIYPVMGLGPDARLVGTVFEKRIISKY
jgi:SOS-response transcriptional repressor LexA